MQKVLPRFSTILQKIFRYHIETISSFTVPGQIARFFLDPNYGLSLFNNTCFFYKKNFYKKMSLKNPKTLRKC